MPNIEPRKFEYSVVDPTKLGETDHTKLNRLYRTSIEFDFPGRTPSEYEYLVEQIDRQRRRINAGVGGPLQRSKQLYAKPRGVVIQDERRSIVGYVSSADNVSSRRIFPVDKLEMWAKMHTDRLVHKKWTTFGSRAFMPELLEGLGKTDEVSIIDVAGHLALLEHDEDQPVSSYPWIGEKLWPDVLKSWGMTDTGDPEKLIYAFGPESSPVSQLHYVRTRDAAPGLAMQIEIAGKAGALATLNDVTVHYKN